MDKIILDTQILYNLWIELFWPLIRITGLVVLGLIIANLIESFSWTKRITNLAVPFTRLANLSGVAAAGFSLAFVSGVSANTLLAEAYDKEEISKRELVLANLFNSLPRFFLHLPTVFFLTLPFIQSAALLYVGLTLLAALLQTFIVILLGRALLEKPEEQGQAVKGPDFKKKSWQEIIKRLKKRIKKILLFLVPIYTLFFILSKYGIFLAFEQYIVENALFLNWLHPGSLSIIILHVTAEFSAGLAAASALLAGNSMSAEQVVLALMIGNLLATPIRAVRHQFPYYSGIYPFKTAVELILLSQTMRAACIVAVTAGFYYFFF